MAWYHKILQKLNPAQAYSDRGAETSKEKTYNYTRAYEEVEIVNRGVNLIVDDCAEIPVIVGREYPGTAVYKGIRAATVERLLNHEPNPFQDINTFRRNLFIDYLIDGNIFIYFDGSHLYHLSAPKMVIHPSKDRYIEKFSFTGTELEFKPTEIIHVKENSFDSIYRGTSRLKPALRTMQLMMSMRDFQDNFFTNGAVPGLVLKSPNTLSERIKARMIESWIIKYNPNTGGRRPLILDGGLEIDQLTNVNFKDLDFQTSITDNEKIVLKALGVPPILLDSGNNANIRPNMRMYYLETILSIVRKVNYAYERFFGFTIKENVIDIPALHPELQEQAAYYSTLVNGGILTAEEARIDLGRPEVPEHGEIRVPANVAGSAVDPSQGGKPPQDPNKEGTNE